MAKDGSLFYVRHSTCLLRNYGDNSNVGRQLYAKVLDSKRKKLLLLEQKQIRHNEIHSWDLVKQDKSEYYCEKREC